MPEERLSMRLDPATRAALEWLAQRLHLNTANVVRLAVSRLARAEGMPEEQDAEPHANR
jgi:antitoxin component of RelBE/YafQ-DinJ toxin-antitoxin module